MDLPDDIAFLARARHGQRRIVPDGVLARAVRSAREEGCAPADWLIANEHVTERLYHRLLAAHLGLPYAEPEPGSAAQFPGDLERWQRIRERPDGAQVAPRTGSVEPLRRAVRDVPALRERLAVASPSLIRSARRVEASRSLLRGATDDLATARADASARNTLTRPQGTALLLGMLALAVLAVAAPAAAGLALHLATTLFFLGCVVLRVALIGRRHWNVPTRHPAPSRPAPVYSVLVALYDEAEQVPDLIAALEALDWPRAKLDIKLVCEADDRATLDAIARVGLPPTMEVVPVPPHGLRTKPKALAYALPLVRGEFVVLYDAEDRPDPGQLREAFAAFETHGPATACLQARLVIDNACASPITRLFATEYAVLFDGLLPALASYDGPVPLGGTSNHLRTAPLREVGGWDPYNVTEDADLGIRLRRAGFQTRTLHSATLEEAPATFAPWFRQRTRWMKGWMQTTLVHLRHPVRTARDLGARSFIVFLFFSVGLPIGALAHVVYLAQLAVQIARYLLGLAPLWLGPIDLIDFTVVATGYLTFILLARRILRDRGLHDLVPWIVFLPLYWMAISVAAWRALWQLAVEPHRWEKTPHGLSHRSAPDTRPARTAHPAE